jgi:hypothetical protein
MNSADRVRVGVKSQRKLVFMSVAVRRDQRDYVRSHSDVLPNFSAFCRECIETAMRGRRTEFPATKHGPRAVRGVYVFADQATWIRRNKINRSALVQAELDSVISRHRKIKEGERNGDSG